MLIKICCGGGGRAIVAEHPVASSSSVNNYGVRTQNKQNIKHNRTQRRVYLNQRSLKSEAATRAPATKKKTPRRNPHHKPLSTVGEVIFRRQRLELVAIKFIAGRRRAPLAAHAKKTYQLHISFARFTQSCTRVITRPV